MNVADEPDDAGTAIGRLDRLADFEFGHGGYNARGCTRFVGGGDLSLLAGGSLVDKFRKRVNASNRKLP